MPRAPLQRPPDWLVIGQERWDEVERRNQLLVRALAAHHPRSRFLFAELPLRARDVRAWRVPRVRPVAPNVWAMRSIRPFPGARFAPVSDRIEAAQLRRAARTLGLDRPMLWTQDPRAAALVDRLRAGGIVYDLTDDWAAFETDPERRAGVQANVESLVRKADLVLACSRPLERMARSWSERVRYVPNAVEAPSAAVEKEPTDLRKVPRPRLGYVGTLHPSRLDVELLVSAAELRPAWSFVLLGPNLLGAADSERLLALANVDHLGVRPHARVRAYLAALDVCLIPHLVTPFTSSLDPLKLYEYLAAGRPVVATPVDNAPELQEHIVHATTAEQLVDVCERVIAEDGPTAATARREAVAGMTWEARAQEIEAALNIACTPRRNGAVCAVVVSFNTRDLLEECIHSLQAQQGVELRTIVVDNASTDGSAELVRTFADTELIEMPQNAGFGAANNVAFAQCDSEYVLLLNSDAVLAAGALAQLVAVAQRHARAAVVGPRLLNPDGTLQRSAWPFPRAGRLMLEALGLHRPMRRLGILEDLGTWDHDTERTVDFLSGACLLLRTDALAEVGGFDERFWLYGEEADLQQRLATRGWKVIFTPTAAATHVGAASSSASVRRLRNFYAGQRRFLETHGTPLSWPVARLALLVGSMLRRRWEAARVALERWPD